MREGGGSGAKEVAALVTSEVVEVMTSEVVEVVTSEVVGVVTSEVVEVVDSIMNVTNTTTCRHQNHNIMSQCADRKMKPLATPLAVCTVAATVAKNSLKNLAAPTAWTVQALALVEDIAEGEEAVQ